jgi:hypothetical protein
MAYQGTLQISPQDIYSPQPDNAGVWLGQRGQTQDGRGFVFALNSAAGALAVGKHVAAPAAVANHLSRTLTTSYAAGSLRINVPLGATAATLNQYQYGYLVVVSGTGLGQQFVVKSNTAAASSGTTVVTLDNKTPVWVALDNTSVVSLYPAQWNGIALSAAALTQEVVGVPVVATPASYYTWLQVSGRCSVLTDSAGAIAKGTEVTASTVVAGAVAASATTNVGQTLGFAPEATVTSQYQPILLQII